MDANLTAGKPAGSWTCDSQHALLLMDAVADGKILWASDLPGILLRYFQRTSNQLRLRRMKRPSRVAAVKPDDKLVERN